LQPIRECQQAAVQKAELAVGALQRPHLELPRNAVAEFPRRRRIVVGRGDAEELDAVGGAARILVRVAGAKVSQEHGSGGRRDVGCGPAGHVRGQRRASDLDLVRIGRIGCQGHERNAIARVEVPGRRRRLCGSKAPIGIGQVGDSETEEERVGRDTLRADRRRLGRDALEFRRLSCGGGSSQGQGAHYSEGKRSQCHARRLASHRAPDPALSFRRVDRTELRDGGGAADRGSLRGTNGAPIGACRPPARAGVRAISPS